LKFPFPVAVFAVNRSIVGIYGNLGLRNFICPHAILEIYLNIYMYRSCLFKFLTFEPQVRWPAIPP